MDREQRLKRQKEILIQVVYWLVWVCAVVVIIKYVGPVLLPFVLAFVVAWVLSFPVGYVTEKLHMNRSFAAVSVVVLFYTLIGAALYLLGSRIVTLVQVFYSDITYFFLNTIFPMAQAFYGWLNGLFGGAAQMAGQTSDGGAAELVSQAGEMLSGVSVKVISGVSDMASNIPGICMNILLMLIATIFMELEFPEILKFLGRQIPESWQKAVTEIRTYTLGTLGKCIVSYILILGLTYVELSIGFLCLQIEGAFTIAFFIAILDILPVLGTGTVLLPWMIIAIASGNLIMGIGILVLYLVITVVRNIVEPRLVGSQMGLSPVVMLPCMILGLHFFGLFGLFFLPYGVAFVKSLNDRGVIHIFKMEDKEGKKY